VLYGRSLGSGPSCHLAAKTALLAKHDAEFASEDGPVGGLILHAPFLSVFRVVIDTGCTLPGDKFSNLDVIPMVKSPVMLIHGTSDQIVPFHHSERLFNAVSSQHRARPLYIEGMSHNNVHSQVRPMFVDRLTEYLESHVWPTAVSQQPSPISNSNKVRKRTWKVELERSAEDDPQRARLAIGV
jgi:abhydrolase domain-containing protein 17